MSALESFFFQLKPPDKLVTSGFKCGSNKIRRILRICTYLAKYMSTNLVFYNPDRFIGK